MPRWNFCGGMFLRSIYFVDIFLRIQKNIFLIQQLEAGPKTIALTEKFQCDPQSKKVCFIRAKFNKKVLKVDLSY